MSKIIENLWLGNINDSQNESFIKTNNINVVVNCTKDIPFVPVVHFKYRIPVNDDLQDKSFQEMYAAITHIIPVLIEHVNRGDRILIHCFAGMQRSAIVTLALLTAITYKEVFKNVKPDQNMLQKYCTNLRNYMSEQRPIVFTPGMNFQSSYTLWLNDYIKKHH